mgnify:CR=1 FL=1
MKSTIFIIMMLIASSAYGQQAQETREGSNARPKKPPVDVAELIFKRMDSNHDGSISLKEFKSAFPRLRHSSTRSGQAPTRSTQGRTRGFDGRTPSFRPESGSRSRGRSYRGSRGRSK